MPKASVIIATYNWSSVLPYSIASALDQTESDIEVLVIGDGCTDDSERVVRSIGDSRVRWFNLPERFGHQAGPNNEGLRQARSEFVFYLGHDDLWLPDHVEQFLGIFESGSDLVYGITARIDEKGTAEMIPERLAPFGPGMWIPPTGFAHRLSVVGEAGNWPDYREITRVPECEFTARVFEAGFRVGICSRLTAVKFSAARRPGVYETKPSHEQRQWLGRIRSDDQLEAKLLGGMLVSESLAHAQQPITVEAAGLIKRVVRGIVTRLKLGASSRERIDESKRFKGSDR